MISSALSPYNPTMRNFIKVVFFMRRFVYNGSCLLILIALFIMRLPFINIAVFMVN